MNIGVDIDEVVRNLNVEIVNVYKKFYDANSKVTYYDLNWQLDDIMPLMKPKADFFRLYAKELFFDAKVIDGATYSLQRLIDDGHKVHLITSQNKGLEHYTLNWIYAHSIPYDSINFNSNKALLNCDILLDDGLQNLKAFPGLAVCYSHPWNKDWDGNKVKNWDEFLKLVEDIKL
jgi:5'(3')-deoxyribonucleotidase